MIKNTLLNQLLESKFSMPAAIVIGILVTIIIIKLQPEMQHTPQDKAPVAVSTIKITKQLVHPTITGFGTVEPDLTLQAKAEVRGRVVYVHPELKKGAILAKDTLMIKIDDIDYQLSLKQAQADLLSSQANLKETELTIKNTELDLKLAVEKLAIREKEFKRLEKLKRNGSISQSKLDSEKQNLLQQQQEVQQLENKQTTLPSEVAVIEAKIEISVAKVEQSKRDLERTEIKLPFNARVRQVEVDQEQFVAQGASLFDVSGMDKVIINAQFPVSQFRQIANSFERDKIDFSKLTSDTKMSDLFDSLGLTAKVFIAGSPYQGWQAKVERISDNIDPQSRTIGVVVSVSDSYKNIDPTKRPPLLEGNYMQVRLSGKKQSYLAVPRFALHQKQIYRVNSDSRLERVNLKNIHTQGELALLSEGVSENDQIITSDLFPAINGMLVESIADDKTQSHLNLWLEQVQ